MPYSVLLIHSNTNSMTLTDKIKSCIDKSVLCWLATSSADNIPNVSPKEIFNYYNDDTIIIANIASPQSVNNIKANPNICLSFIDILIQKGYQIKGHAKVITSLDDAFLGMHQYLSKMTDGQFPFSSIIVITPHHAKPIIAPKYVIYPDTTEAEQIKSAKKVYRL